MHLNKKKLKIEKYLNGLKIDHLILNREIQIQFFFFFQENMVIEFHFIGVCRVR